jgi:exosome complex exonuclease RRP6
MLQYARSDTHFLLYIYDNLRNALLDRATSRAQSRAQSPSTLHTTSNSSSSGNAAYELIKQVLARSEETALRLYEKEVYDEEGGSGSNGWDTLARKWNKGALMAGGPDAGIVALQMMRVTGKLEYSELFVNLCPSSLISQICPP